MENIKKSYRCMKDLDLFSSLNAEEKNRIVELAQSKYYKKGQMIFREGESLNAIYLICFGQVWLTKTAPSGKEIVLNILDQGQIMGENTFLENLECNINARAEENTMICVCDARDMQELLTNPDIAIKIIKTLTEKLNQYSENIVNLAFYDVKDRVLNLLKKLSVRYGEHTEEGVLLTFYISHDEIAQMVNASRVMVTNVIKSLKDEFFIDVVDRKFLVRGAAFLTAR